MSLRNTEPVINRKVYWTARFGNAQKTEDLKIGIGVLNKFTCSLDGLVRRFIQNLGTKPRAGMPRARPASSGRSPPTSQVLLANHSGLLAPQIRGAIVMRVRRVARDGLCYHFCPFWQPAAHGNGSTISAKPPCYYPKDFFLEGISPLRRNVTRNILSNTLILHGYAKLFKST